jgi:hypothetical protein
MDYYIKVLLVDDDPRYAKALQDRAYGDYKIELIHYEDWEEAKTELFENINKYSAVILDALGKTRKGESGDNPQHISTAIRDINRKGKNIKYYVLTAYYDNVVSFIPDDESIFHKNSEEDKLFKLISDNFRNSAKSKIAQKHPEIVEFVDDHFLNEQINFFIELFSEITEVPDIFKDLPKLRVLNERTVDILGLKAGNFNNLNELYTFIREDDYDVKEGSRTVDILRYFSDKIQRVPEGIYHNIQAIYQTASSVASHSRKKETYVPSSMQVVAFKYGLLETIKWVADYLETKTKK